MNKIYELCQFKTSFYTCINYCYIMVDKRTRSSLIVDPSWELETIERKLEELNCHLVAILLTHSHYDHINMVKYLVGKYNVQVYMSEIEIEYYHFESVNLIGIKDMETLEIGDLKVVCLLTPGHTKGSMCYFAEDVLFTGDTVFIEGCGMCYGNGSSGNDMYESFQRIKNVIPIHAKVYPGHSYGKEVGRIFAHLKKENIYFLIDKREDFIRFRMRENQKNLFNFK